MKKEQKPKYFLFSNHMTTFVQFCGFKAAELADLRADFRIFVDTKNRKLPRACNSLLSTVGNFAQSQLECWES